MSLHLVQSMAAEIGDTLQRFMTSRSISRDELASERYRSLMESLASLEQAARDGIEADHRDAQAGLGWCIRNLMGFGARGRRLSEQRDELASEVDSLLGRVRKFVETHAEPNLPVPDDLRRLSEQWRQAAASAEAIDRRIPTLAGVDGWQGEASAHYGSMVALQQRATQELSALPSVIADAYVLCGDLNKAALSGVERALRQARLRGAFCDVIPRPFGLFPRAVQWRVVLADLLPELDGMMASSDEGSCAASERIQRARESVDVVREGWPSGASGAQMAGHAGRGRCLGRGPGL